MMPLDRWLQSQLVDIELTRRVWLGKAASIAYGAWALGRSPLTASEPSKPVRSCIVLWMVGGASQLDTFDLKPGHRNGGPFQEIETSVPGIRIGEHLPRMARRVERLAIIRSMSTIEGDHGRATQHLSTGYQPRLNIDYPHIGSLLANERRDNQQPLPDFVTISPPTSSGQPAGFLGSHFAPLAIRPTIVEAGNPDQPNSRVVTLGVDNLAPPHNLSSAKLQNRSVLLRSLNNDFAARQPDLVSSSHRIAYERAERLMDPNAANAFDLTQESAAVRAAYGSDAFGQGCLLARRLVERNVGFVEVRMDGSFNNWDTHVQNFTNVQTLCSELDRPWSQLLDDLKERGLLDSTLVVWMGEFGRTPTINSASGRDHYPAAWSTVLAGANIRGGQVIGRTSQDGMTVEDRPVTVPDFLATLCRVLGIDPAKQNVARDGQPIRVVDRAAKPITELLG